MATFDEYIANPMGGKTSVFTQREMYRNVYTQKLNNILLREAGKFDYFLYKDKDKYIAHIKVPSEVVPKFYYDVVIEFSPKEINSKLSKTLNNSYNIRVFSNDPAFVFTFAHAFIENDLFFNDLTPKMSKQAVKKPASEKNPQNQIGYVKSIYFAYLMMRQSGLFNKLKFDTESKKYSKKVLLDSIEHADKKINDRQEKAEEIEKKKRVEKSKEISKHNEERNYNPDSNITRAKSSIISKTISKTKNTKRTERVKRV